MPLRWWTAATALLALGLLGGGCGDGSEPAPGPRPNVVVVLLDTVRPDYYASDQPHHAAAPYLNALRDSAVVFANARSTSSWTAPATASLFTGLYPNEHGVIQGFMAHANSAERLRQRGDATIDLNALPTSLSTLPEVMQQAGYRTFGLAANINIGPEIGFDRGFDRFVRLDDDPAAVMVDSVAVWLPALRGDGSPWFLYLHFNDAHEPYVAHEPWYVARPDDRLADARSRYLSELSYLDSQLARLSDLLDLRRQDLLVLVSDHGEEFQEHGQEGHPPTLYRELNDVLMLMHAPGLGFNPAVRAADVSLIDVLPTILDLLVIPPLKPAAGLSLLSLCRDDGQTVALQERLAARTLFAHRLQNLLRGEHLWSAMRGDWKRIREGGRGWLYHRGRDPAEKQPLSRSNDPVAAGLESDLAAFRRRPPAGRAADVSIPLDQEMTERLRSLGYVR